ncbi:DUF678 domain-containing protein [Bizionia algoritergicola]|uniref:DUF678 domain-containing protein n=1 Tax=Bizionia algoritergicola TaxID=291187 RepID=A0A5D0QX90_9FLAO|nr:DUF678 domain-containing protein [Bizionia algoritergicola]
MITTTPINCGKRRKRGSSFTNVYDNNSIVICSWCLGFLIHISCAIKNRELNSYQIIRYYITKVVFYNSLVIDAILCKCHDGRKHDY